MRLDHLLSKGRSRGCIAVELPGRRLKEKKPAAMRPGGTRVPIPNTRVKPRAADDTVLETVWESRRLPESKKEKEEIEEKEERKTGNT